VSGQNLMGNWSLTVRDRTAGDTGTLRAFSLIVCLPPM
jgi:subtilisin-like proprotein convertase family protein